MSDQIAIAITVFEGRNFQAAAAVAQEAADQSKLLLYLQCRFQNEVLTTDPVPLNTSGSPVWDTELAWQLDYRTLKYLRSQRQMLKLQCFLLDIESSKRHLVGYLMLDLRQAVLPSQAQPQWKPLVHMKSIGYRPEILLCFSVDDGTDTEPQVTHTSAQTRSVSFHDMKSERLPTPLPVPAQSPPQRQLQEPPKPSPKKPINVPNGPLEKSVNVFKSTSGVYQIGSGLQNYLFSINLMSASDLAALVPLAPPTSSLGYFFSCRLFDEQFVSTRFHDLSRPDFVPERFALRVRSSRPELLTLFRQLQGVTISLGCDGGVLANGYFDITPLLSAAAEVKSMDIQSPLAIQSDLRFHSASPDFPDLPPSGHLIAQFVVQPDAEPPMVVVESDSLVEQVPNSAAISQELVASTTAVPLSAPVHFGAPPSGVTNATLPFSKSTSIQLNPSLAQLGTQIPTERVDPHWHRYRFSVDLRSIVNCRRHFAGLTLRTSFPPLTKDHPVATYPPIHAYPAVENLIPHSLCSFEFRMDHQQLAAFFDSIPLRIEIIQTLPSTEPMLSSAEKPPLVEKIIAIGEQLIPILNQPHEKIVGPQQSTSGSSQLYSATIELFNEPAVLEDGTKAGKLGDLLVVLHLEDFGIPLIKPDSFPSPADRNQNSADVSTGFASVTNVPQSSSSTAQVIALQSEQEAYSRTVHTTSSPSRSTSRATAKRQMTGKRSSSKVTASSPVVVARKTPIRRTKEYKTALALEQWKSAEREQFERKIAVEERTLMSQQAEEWADREALRNESVRKKIAELEETEDQARTVLRTLEAREKALALREREFELRKSDLEQQYERFLQESKDVSRRMHDDYSALLKAENQKIVELEAQKQSLLDEKALLSAKYDGLRDEHQQAQQRHRQSLSKQTNAATAASKPHATEMDVSRLRNEKRNLETQIQTIDQSKQYYKQAWIKAVHDFVQLRKQLDSAKQRDMDKEMRELEHMRQRYLAQEEAAFLGSSQQQYFNHSAPAGDNNNQENFGSSTGGYGKQRASLSAAVAQPPISFASAASSSAAAAASAAASMASPLDSEIQRLERERDSLLKSGVYQPEDRLIRVLQDKIDELRVK